MEENIVTREIGKVGSSMTSHEIMVALYLALSQAMYDIVVDNNPPTHISKNNEDGEVAKFEVAIKVVSGQLTGSISIRVRPIVDKPRDAALFNSATGERVA